MTKLIEIQQAAYHRNGVGGNGFFVGTVCVEIEGHTHRMLVTFFPSYTEDGERLPAGKNSDGNYDNMSIAVLDLDLLPSVEFGINSWRGDNFCAIADAIVAKVNQQYDDRDAALIAQAEARKAGV